MKSPPFMEGALVYFKENANREHEALIGLVNNKSEF
jgi:hypothetical protein